MKQESEIRNGIVSAWESSVSEASVLETNCKLHILHGSRDRFNLSHALHNYVGIFQPMSGSTKIPSCLASHVCAARICSSLTIAMVPCDSAIAAIACFQLAGFPIRMADATVSGFSMTRL